MFNIWDFRFFSLSILIPRSLHPASLIFFQPTAFICVYRTTLCVCLAVCRHVCFILLRVTPSWIIPPPYSPPLQPLQNKKYNQAYFFHFIHSFSFFCVALWYKWAWSSCTIVSAYKQNTLQSVLSLRRLLPSIRMHSELNPVCMAALITGEPLSGVWRRVVCYVFKLTYDKLRPSSERVKALPCRRRQTYPV